MHCSNSRGLRGRLLFWGECLLLKQVSLRARIFVILAVLVVTTLGGGLMSLWATQRMEALVRGMIDVDVVALQAATDLESALVMQKGLVTYFFLDSNSEWLKQLEHYHQAFQGALKRARSSTRIEAARAILNEIETEYLHYIASRDQVIRFYREGQREAGGALHREVRGQFLAIYGLCEQYKKAHEENIAETRAASRSQARLINTTAALAMPAALTLGILLAYILIHQVLGPIRQLALGSSVDAGREPLRDEVKALSRRVSSLIEDVDQTQSELQLSREHLQQSEKLALVGKLAAGVAHSIRNPLTSVKMRLFSMERTLEMSANQKEDFEVISEEIRHIDTILRNFLEFSRPPKLHIQNVSPSDVVDMAIQLLRHRLESYAVDVDLYRQRRLPQIQGDPEQLKELLVNLMVNACEAMAEGGSIVIREEEGVTEPLGRVVVIRISDTGPGVPESIKDKVFQPFFTTKEEGTGLGLSIAARIVEDHGGCLNLRTREGKGATFIITLPCREDGAWLRS
jgi:signal transduction histidine kinase